MPLEHPFPSTQERADELNSELAGQSAEAVLRRALNAPNIGRTALVSSFGAESVVLLHLLAKIDKSAPVLFVDTEMLFRETLEYQAEVAQTLGLKNVTVVRPDRDQIIRRDTENRLHVTQPDACCALRKTEPLRAALEPFDGWITGRKRFQSGQRKALEFFESDGESRIKINPLAMWSQSDVQDYIAAYRLPKHPLVDKGFASLGCAPCTTKVIEGEPQRAGRWRGRAKDECGIHFENGQVVRTSAEDLI